MDGVVGDQRAAPEPTVECVRSTLIDPASGWPIDPPSENDPPVLSVAPPHSLPLVLMGAPCCVALSVLFPHQRQMHFTHRMITGREIR